MGKKHHPCHRPPCHGTTTFSPAGVIDTVALKKHDLLEEMKALEAHLREVAALETSVSEKAAAAAAATTNAADELHEAIVAIEGLPQLP